MTTGEDVPWPAQTGMLQVGDLQVDLRYRQVIAPEQSVELPQRVFDVLLIFLSQPHVLHSRTALFEQVWAGVVVEDANLSQSIWTLRKALGAERKHWIRTVAKGGYVFEPPAPVVAMPIERYGAETAVSSIAAAIDDSAGISVPDDTTITALSPTSFTTPDEAPADGPSTAPHRVRIGWLTAASVAGVVLLIGLFSLGRFGSQPSQLPAIAPIAVALIEVGNREDTDSRWPATMLHAWLEWKLTGMPELMLLTEAHLAADMADISPHVVLLSAGKSSEDPSQRFVRARFDGPNGSRQLEQRGTAAEMPQLIDKLSKEVLDELVPSRRDQPWPTLDINESVTRAYAKAYTAYSARDMSTAATELSAVLQDAPRFGLAQLQLAMAQARLGQARDALEHMEQAQQLLSPVAEDVARVMAAAAMAVDPQRAQDSATAYAALSAQYPQRITFRLEQAWNEMRSGDPDLALVTLSGVDWHKQPMGTRVQWLLTLAEIEGARLNVDGVRKHAEAAADLARSAGSGWERELASATLLQAQADAFQKGPEAGLERFEEAAQLFSKAGAEIDALYARVSGELTLPPNGRSQQLDTLLAHARAGGYRNLEVQLLRRVAFQQRGAGNLAEYRKRLEDALAIAESSGDAVTQQALHVDLLSEDLLLGEFTRANERIRVIREGPVKGDTATWLDQFEGFLLSINGDYPAAIQALNQTIDRLEREDQPPLPPDTLARLACVRAELMLSQGQMQQARAERDVCASSEQSYLREYAATLSAAIDMLAGDVSSALPRLRQRQTEIASMPPAPSRWQGSLWTAYLLARTGEVEAAEKLYSSTQLALRDTGYEWLIADAEIGMAETAAAQGYWAEATAWADTARERLPATAWQQFHRLDQVGILVAFASGERQEAQSRLMASHSRAHEIGDISAQLESHSLMDALGPYFRPDGRGCDAATRKSLIASTGMRGANLEWMTRALPIRDTPTARGGQPLGPITGPVTP